MQSTVTKDMLSFWLNPPIKSGESGKIKISEFTVTTEDACSFSNLKLGYRGVRPGTYVKMLEGNEIWMSNTHAEYRDAQRFINEAKGKVIINGLGLGLVVHCLLAKMEVTSVTVLEKNPDVINLVAPYFAETYGGRFTCIQADALEYKLPKGVKYDYVWHDIWPDVSESNYPEMKKLHRKWGKAVKEKQYSWCREEVLYKVKEDQKYRNWYR